MVKEIVKRHNGEVWVESVPGKGSVFYFTLDKTGSGENIK
jgi:signal transduction histidine kinase